MHPFFCICLEKSGVAQWKGIKKLITVILNFISCLVFSIPSVFHITSCFAWLRLVQSWQFFTEHSESKTSFCSRSQVLLPNFPWHLWSIFCLFTFLKEWKSTHSGDFLLSCWVWIVNRSRSLSEQPVRSWPTFLLTGEWQHSTHEINKRGKMWGVNPGSYINAKHKDAPA